MQQKESFNMPGKFI